ncbi:hypothetical protein H6F87_24810 [Cyanobacteria bacterium FACHB-502]|nr:hypothetical protein [Cyanobacteria bacterium FACHB-502]
MKQIVGQRRDNGLKQFRLRSLVCIEHTHHFPSKSLRVVSCTVMILGLVLLWSETATAQQLQNNLQKRKAQLEVDKLELEVKELRNEWSSWLTGIVGLLAGFTGTAASIWVARLTRYGELDQSVHDKRIELYPKLVKATAPLAIYFPSTHSSTSSIGPKECREMGQAMSKWYFEDGGLFLSKEAQDAYFKLARALTRASLAGDLRVPTFTQDAQDISKEKVDEYRKALDPNELDKIEMWNFGITGSESNSPAYRFRDFVFLQRLSSILRTELSEDLRSRRRPTKKKY